MEKCSLKLLGKQALAYFKYSLNRAVTENLVKHWSQMCIFLCKMYISDHTYCNFSVPF